MTPSLLPQDSADADQYYLSPEVGQKNVEVSAFVVADAFIVCRTLLCPLRAPLANNPCNSQ